MTPRSLTLCLNRHENTYPKYLEDIGCGGAHRVAQAVLILLRPGWRDENRDTQTLHQTTTLPQQDPVVSWHPSSTP